MVISSRPIASASAEPLAALAPAAMGRPVNPLFDAHGAELSIDPRTAADYDVLMKIVVIGDSAVGKSAVVRRFAAPVHITYFGISC